MSVGAAVKYDFSYLGRLTAKQEEHRRWKARQAHPNNDKNRPYYYLAGPMTNYPQFNFPRFLAVADKLRGLGDLNVVVPAELDSFEVFWDCMQSPDGKAPYDKNYNALVRRDANIVMDDNCVGVITIEGWKQSRGALIETFLAENFDKTLEQYFEYEVGFECVPFKRDEELATKEVH